MCLYILQAQRELQDILEGGGSYIEEWHELSADQGERQRPCAMNCHWESINRRWTKQNHWERNILSWYHATGVVCTTNGFSPLRSTPTNGRGSGDIQAGCLFTLCIRGGVQSHPSDVTHTMYHVQHFKNERCRNWGSAVSNVWPAKSTVYRTWPTRSWTI